MLQLVTRATGLLGIDIEPEQVCNFCNWTDIFVGSRVFVVRSTILHRASIRMSGPYVLLTCALDETNRRASCNYRLKCCYLSIRSPICLITTPSRFAFL